MRTTKQPYSFCQLASAVMMIVALLWLTVSTPFVYASQQELAKHNKAAGGNLLGSAEEETNNSAGNTTEEKKPTSNNSISEEYLHHHHIDDNFICTISRNHTCENSEVYNAFHGEVHVPPPNAA